MKLCKMEIRDFKDCLKANVVRSGNKFCHYLNDVMNDEFFKFWKDQVYQSGENGKLKIYKNIKMNISFENYLLGIQNFKHRQAVTRLRVSAHRLPVETGRYRKIECSDRKCKHCDQNEVGDEEHYIMSCSNTMFVTPRENFLNSLYKINQSFEDFDMQSLFRYILSMKDENIWLLSAKYCFDILKIFDKLQMV